MKIIELKTKDIEYPKLFLQKLADIFEDNNIELLNCEVKMSKKEIRNYECGCIQYETGWLICEYHEKIIKLTEEYIEYTKQTI